MLGCHRHDSFWDVRDTLPRTHWKIDDDFRGFIVMAFAMVLIFSSLIAALGAVEPTAVGVPQGTKAYKHYATLFGSLVLTMVAAVLFSVVHFASNA